HPETYTLSLHDALPISEGDQSARRSVCGRLHGQSWRSQMNGRSIAIYGSGGFGREMAWMAEECGVAVACFLDDDRSRAGSMVNRSEEHTSELQSRENLV